MKWKYDDNCEKWECKNDKVNNMQEWLELQQTCKNKNDKTNMQKCKNDKYYDEHAKIIRTMTDMQER